MFLVTGTVANQESIFIIADTKFYISVVILLTQDNVKLLKQLESGFKIIINWNKYQSTVTKDSRDKNLDILINSSFQGVNRLFILSFEHRSIRQSCKKHFLPAVKVTDNHVMSMEKNFFY